MEARLKRVEDEVVEIRSDVQDVREKVVVLEDRQVRLRDDLQALTSALHAASAEVGKVNSWVDKRGAFIAGIIFILSTLTGLVTFLFTILKDWIFQ
jgi:VIT1/CCC1 family predicted Fe2+/Mn2+ transporter